MLLTLAYSRLKPNFDSEEFAYGELKENCSAMISPTGDKVIIHRHGKGYEKTSFGKSLAGVRGELQVYKLLNEKRPLSFFFSNVQELQSDTEKCRFFMEYVGENISEAVPQLRDLLMPLKEFFLLPDRKMMKWNELWNTLPEDLQKLVPENEKKGETPIGLVHRDFKPWNVKSGVKPLFFDFESASFSGCPLEDFFNYTVDPQLHFFSPEAVWQNIQKNRSSAEMLLKELDCPVGEFARYWHWYLLERISFWRNQEQPEMAKRFQQLFEISKND